MCDMLYVENLGVPLGDVIIKTPSSLKDFFHQEVIYLVSVRRS